jgi:hypothetical protein
LARTCGTCLAPTGGSRPRRLNSLPHLENPVSPRPGGTGFSLRGGAAPLAGGSAGFRSSSDAAISPGVFFDAVTLGRTVVRTRGAGAAAFSGTTLTAEQVEIEGDR